jgi:ribonuclease E
VLRAIEDHLQNKRAENLTAKCAREVASYVLNEKRDNLLAIEQAYGISIFIVVDDNMKGSQTVIERAGERAIVRRPAAAPVKIDSAFDEEASEETEAAEDILEDEESSPNEVVADRSEDLRQDRNGEGNGGRKRRRGRRGGRRGGRDHPADQSGDGGVASEPMHEDDVTELVGAAVEEAADMEDAKAPNVASENGNEPRREGRGRRRMRGGRNRRRGNEEHGERVEAESHQEPDDVPAPEVKEAVAIPLAVAAQEIGPAPEPRRWQPPSPTVAKTEEPVRKAGWWSRRA